MTTLKFSNILEFVNLIPTSAIASEAKQALPEQWALHEGEYRIHGNTFPFSLLHLQSGITSSGAQKALDLVTGSEALHVVYSPHLKRKYNKLPVAVEQFKAEAQRFDSYRDYIRSYIGTELERYTEYLKSKDKPDYIDPSIETPAGVSIKRPNPVASFLIDPDTRASEQEGMLGAILAAPGQGKTYMSEHIVAQLARQPYGVIPIYVCSDQWETMRLDDLSSIWKTLTHSFHFAEAPLAWVSGHEETFLKTTLQSGLFRIVFDGFDEYILRNSGKVSSADAISALAELVSETGARILLTSRTTFWSSERLENEQSISMYEIRPFDVNQASQYFRKKIPPIGSNERKVGESVALFTQLSKSTPALAGRGFVLKLIADLFEGDEPVTPTDADKNTALWLFKALCTRDQKRHTLPLDGKEQLDAIQLFIIESLRGAAPDSELLDLAIADVAPRLDDSARGAAIRKMVAHPLISRLSPDRDEWVVPQDQVRVTLIARFIARCAHEHSPEELSRVIAGLRLAPSFLRDLGNDLLDLDFDVATSRELDRLDRVRRIVRTVLEADEAASSSSKTILPRLAGIILLRLVDTYAGKEHKDRAAVLFDSIPTSAMMNVTFAGTVASFDFSGRTFQSCRFDHVRWHNCEFDEGTRFDRCHFDGIELIRSDTIVEAEVCDCTYDETARDYLKRIEISKGKRDYDVQDLEGDVRCVLQKFVPRGGHIPKTLKESHLRSGTIRVSPHKEIIIEAIKRHVLHEHHISGTSETGLHVREEAKEAFRFFADNNTFTGPLKRAFADLRKKLKLG